MMHYGTNQLIASQKKRSEGSPASQPVAQSAEDKAAADKQRAEAERR